MINQLLESLETRRLFSTLTPITQVTSKGTLIIHGTTGDDSIDVFLIHGRKEDGIGITLQISNGSNTNTAETRVKFNTVKRILIDAGAGDDKITLIGPLASDPSGNAGQATPLPIPATVLGGRGGRQHRAGSHGPPSRSGRSRKRHPEFRQRTAGLGRWIKKFRRAGRGICGHRQHVRQHPDGRARAMMFSPEI